LTKTIQRNTRHRKLGILLKKSRNRKNNPKKSQKTTKIRPRTVRKVKTRATELNSRETLERPKTEILERVSKTRKNSQKKARKSQKTTKESRKS
jgi:hypothetical protein